MSEAVTLGDSLLGVGGVFGEIWFLQTTRQRWVWRPRRRSAGGSAIGSALCSRLLGGARLCSVLLGSGLGLCDKPQAGGVVAAILTSEGSLVRTQLRPPSGLHVSVGTMFTFDSDILAVWPGGLS